MTDATRQAELEAQGWTACFVTDEPRLSEAIGLYESLGLEVRLGALSPGSSECAACLEHGTNRCMMIYTRPLNNR